MLYLIRNQKNIRVLQVLSRKTYNVYASRIYLYYARYKTLTENNDKLSLKFILKLNLEFMKINLQTLKLG